MLYFRPCLRSRKKNLVVEGAAEALDLITQQELAQMGYAVATATHGSAALQAALKLQPDILIAAFDRPGEAELDLLTALRSQQSSAYIIALGSKGTEHPIPEAFRLGAVALTGHFASLPYSHLFPLVSRHATCIAIELRAICECYTIARSSEIVRRSA